HRRVQAAIALGRIDPNNLLFSPKGADEELLKGVQAIDELERAAALFRTHPIYQAPDTFRRALRDLLDSGRLSFLN
ncbi:MAG: RNA polymerase sigma factor, partial [Anaerolineae bacterium]|nr:RNA polymerase sigma factor [Anaerolineae bacterium]